MEITTMKRILKVDQFVKLMNECIEAQFLLRHGVVVVVVVVSWVARFLFSQAMTERLAYCFSDSLF